MADTPADATREAQLVDRGIEFLRAAARGDAGRAAVGGADTGRADAGGANGGSADPWALFISTEAPHDPYVVPRELYERYDAAAIKLPASFSDDLSDKPAVYRRIAAAWDDLSEEQVKQAIACYYAACSGIDDQFGRLLAALEETGQAEDTLVVFTSDHGDYLGAHGLFLKGVPAFEEAYRMPLVVRGPGIAPGTVIEEPVSLLDLGRTLVTLLLGEDFGGHGRDLSDRLRGGPPLDEPQAFAEFHGQRLGYTQRIVWRERYKYVFNGFDDDELYDLRDDPHELTNLAKRPQSQDVLREMAAAMWRVVKETGDDTLGKAEYGMFRFAPVGPGVTTDQRKGER
ncbi:MAG TPA: sulfatase-like hydrolase/transferase [Trueperaceae bacterium]|nr:sulfatase-like hydrolase/transferase [Trueperaceae bacterium]